MAGSSPHTRGALSLGPAILRRRRIIPAYAGSTSGAFSLRLGGGGSSPHTRGALAEGVPVAHFPGIIPAYAGSTSGTQH